MEVDTAAQEKKNEEKKRKKNRSNITIIDAKEMLIYYRLFWGLNKIEQLLTG